MPPATSSSGSSRTISAFKTIHKINRTLSLLPQTIRRKIRRSDFCAAGALLLTALIAPIATYAAPLPQVSTFILPNTPGTTNITQPVTVHITGGGTLMSVSVVTQGTTGLDFTDAGTNDTCTVGQSLSNTSCNVTVKFQPKAPGGHFGAVVLAFDNGNTATQYLYGFNQGPLGVIIPGLINTVAGSNNSLYVSGSSDNIPANTAPVQLPLGEIIDAAGNLYLSDWGNARIRKVDNTAQHIISTWVGGGNVGVITPGLAATSATIEVPSGLAMDGAGNLYFADRGASVIYMVSPGGVISILAGMQGTAGFHDGPVLQAQLTQPNGLAIDANQILYIADTGNNAIRKIDLKVDPSDRTIYTIAGTGTPIGGFGGDGQDASSAVFNQPWGLAIGPNNLLYIADVNNNVIRRIDPVNGGTTATVVGKQSGQGAYAGDGGPANKASLHTPEAVVVDLAGNIYVADTQNNVIRKATLQKDQTYIINTLSGNPSSQTFSGDGSNADVATMSSPSSLALDSIGNLYFGDLFHNRVRMISSQSAILDYGQIKNFRVSPAKVETLENDGNDTMKVTQLTSVYAALDDQSTCQANSMLDTAASCTLDVEFAPQVPNLPSDGQETPGSVTIATSAANTPNVVNLIGDVLTVNPTTTTVVSNGTPSATGATVAFTATVANGSSGALTGTVTFMDASAPLGQPQTLNAAGVATFSTSSLMPGTHSITAVYSGDTNNAPSTSPVFTQIVKTGTALTVVITPSTVTFPQTVTITATITGATTPVGGTVTFSDGSAALGTVTPTGAGVAQLSSIQLAPGNHTINAVFSGDNNNLGSTGSATQNVLKTPDTTAISSDNSAPTYGTPITLTATVTSTGNPTAPSPLTGSVIFKDTTTGIQLGNISLANGTASVSASTLAPGLHNITAAYSGDANNTPSNSTSPQVETVAQIATAVAVTSASNTVNAGTPVTFTATVTIPSNTTAGGPLSGTIKFSDNGTPISPAINIAASGNIATASFTASTFTPGPHSITATYSVPANSNYSGNTSPAFPLSVSKNTSTTTLSTTTPNPSIGGQAINLTAVVSGPTGAATPTGTVTFTANPGSISLGHATLNAGGQAVLPPVTSLAPGTYQITATYAGDSNNNSSNSSLGQTINHAGTALTLVSNANSAKVGDKVTFTASLGSINDQPTGTVTFLDNNAAIGQVQVASTTVTFSTTTLSAGPHTITASYGGDTDDNAATSMPVSVQVQQLPTNAVLASSTTPGAYSQPIAFTVTITSENVAPTGSVQFFDGASTIGTSSVIASGPSATGTASLTVSSLALGNHSIVAKYLGDANHITTQSNTISQQVLYTPGVVVTSANPSVTAGQNVTLTANVTGVQNIVPTGTVTFRDGPSVLGVTRVLPGSAAATGVATFSTSSLTPGSHSIVATYSGDTDYQTASSQPTAQSVIIANTTISLSSTANPATSGTPLTFTSTVTGTGGTVSGTVTFMDGAATVGSVTLSKTGVATLTTSALTPGQHTITAVYSGDTDNRPNTSTPLQQSVEQATVTSIISSANPAPTLAPIVITCTVSNGGTHPATGSVIFTDGSTLLGTVTLDGNAQASLSFPSLPAGQHNITARYSGDSIDFPSASAPYAQSVQLRPTTDVLTATTTSLTDGKQLTLISVLRWTGPVTPTGTVNFSIGNTVIGTATLDKVGVATLTIILDPGSATVVASYSGDSVYAPSSSPATGVTDGPPTSFTVKLTSQTLSLKSKQNTTVDLNITSLNGFSDTLTFGCLGLPYAASCTFSSTQVTLQPNGTQTIHVVVDTSAPLLANTGTTTATSGLGGTSKRVLLIALLSSLLPGFLLMRSRKRRPLTGLLILLCSIVLASGLSGCGALDINGTPAGTYTFKITAAGTKTNITQTADMTLTVTQ